MMIVREYRLVHFLSECFCVIASERAKTFSGACYNITSAGCRITAVVFFLIDAAIFNYQLKSLVDLFHISNIDSRDLKALSVCYVYHAFSVFRRDIDNALQ